MGTAPDKERKPSVQISVRVDFESHEALRWWSRFDAPGIPLATRIRSSLEALAADIITNYDPLTNSTDPAITQADLDPHVRRSFGYRQQVDREGSA